MEPEILAAPEPILFNGRRFIPGHWQAFDDPEIGAWELWLPDWLEPEPWQPSPWVDVLIAGGMLLPFACAAILYYILGV